MINGLAPGLIQHVIIFFALVAQYSFRLVVCVDVVVVGKSSGKKVGKMQYSVVAASH